MRLCDERMQHRLLCTGMRRCCGQSTCLSKPITRAILTANSAINDWSFKLIEVSLRLGQCRS